MEIPILLSANPRHASETTFIPIRFAKWGIRAEGLEDSVLGLLCEYHTNSSIKQRTSPLSVSKIYEGSCRIKVTVMKPGTEESISLFAFERK